MQVCLALLALDKINHGVNTLIQLLEYREFLTVFLANWTN